MLGRWNADRGRKVFVLENQTLSHSLYPKPLILSPREKILKIIDRFILFRINNINIGR